jgi:hypothetical protein
MAREPGAGALQLAAEFAHLAIDVTAVHAGGKGRLGGDAHRTGGQQRLRIGQPRVHVGQRRQVERQLAVEVGAFGDVETDQPAGAEHPQACFDLRGCALCALGQAGDFQPPLPVQRSAQRGQRAAGRVLHLLQQRTQRLAFAGEAAPGFGAQRQREAQCAQLQHPGTGLLLGVGVGQHLGGRRQQGFEHTQALQLADAHRVALGQGRRKQAARAALQPQCPASRRRW